MNHTKSLDELKDERALRREKKRRPRMRVHGKNLKRSTVRAILRIAKTQRKKQ